MNLSPFPSPPRPWIFGVAVALIALTGASVAYKVLVIDPDRNTPHATPRTLLKVTKVYVDKQITWVPRTEGTGARHLTLTKPGFVLLNVEVSVRIDDLQLSAEELLCRPPFNSWVAQATHASVRDALQSTAGPSTVATLDNLHRAYVKSFTEGTPPPFPVFTGLPSQAEDPTNTLELDVQKYTRIMAGDTAPLYADYLVAVTDTGDRYSAVAAYGRFTPLMCYPAQLPLRPIDLGSGARCLDPRVEAGAVPANWEFLVPEDAVIAGVTFRDRYHVELRLDLSVAARDKWLEADDHAWGALGKDRVVDAGGARILPPQRFQQLSAPDGKVQFVATHRSALLSDEGLAVRFGLGVDCFVDLTFFSKVTVGQANDPDVPAEYRKHITNDGFVLLDAGRAKVTDYEGREYAASALTIRQRNLFRVPPCKKAAVKLVYNGEHAPGEWSWDTISRSGRTILGLGAAKPIGLPVTYIFDVPEGALVREFCLGEVTIAVPMEFEALCPEPD